MMNSGLSPDKAKLKAETIGPYTVITVNHDFKTCQDKTRTEKEKPPHGLT